MRIYSENGAFALENGSGLAVNDITAFAEYAGKDHNILKIVSGEWTETKREDGVTVLTDGIFTVELTCEKNIVFVRGGFTPKNEISSLIRVCFFRGMCDRRFEKVYLNGFTMFNGVKVGEMQSPVLVRKFLKNQRDESVDFACGICSDGTCVAAGAVSYERNYSDIEICENGDLLLCVPTYWHTALAGETVSSDVFALFCDNGLGNSVEKFSALTAKRNHAGKRCGFDVRSGWCSWYYYGANISENDILENMSEIKARGLNVECIQIDDGWNKKRGDWEPNERFPHGMKYLADEIKKNGFIPGIWVAPLTAENDSELLNKHPEMFVKNWNDDKPCGFNSLDLSVPEARKYLYDLFRKLTAEWGFEYIKFDFAGFGISAGRYADPNFNGTKNYRKALEIMRDAVGDETFLLACTSPINATVGVADGLRTSADIFERWESVRQIASQIIFRSYFGENIKTDPDCVMMRNAENEDGKCFRKCTRTDKEIETHMTLVAVTGGMVMMSDKICLLPTSKTDKFKCLLLSSRRRAKFIDLCDSAIPSIADCGEKDGVYTFTFFNWEDHRQDFVYRLNKKYFVYDFWEKKILGEREEISLSLAPHECKVLHCALDNSRFAAVGAFEKLLP